MGGGKEAHIWIAKRGKMKQVADLLLANRQVYLIVTGLVYFMREAESNS